MRILIIQFISDTRGRPVPRFDPQLGTLAALLKRRGHELSLLGSARFDLDAIKSALARDLPQLIYADIAPVCVDPARRTLHYINEHQFLPIVAGGAYPTVDPAGCLSLPGVQAVAIGEPDASLITYLERIKDPAGGQVVPGVWLRDEQGLVRPDMPALVENLDSLPFAERDLFEYAAHIARTGQIEIAVGRGCPQQCAYCVNDWLQSIYENRGAWVRRRSPGNILAEIDLLRQRYATIRPARPAEGPGGVRRVRFLDHAFAIDEDWLAGMLAAYRERCGLPFRCHVRANALTAAIAQALREAGCTEADIEVISGSDFIRNEIFDMELSGERLRAAFGAMRGVGIQTRAIVYLGAPYESEASLDETAALLRELRPTFTDVRPYFPFPGTRARETAAESGWLHPRGEGRYAMDRCGIDMPACRTQVVERFIRRLRREFPGELGEPWWRRWPARSGDTLVQLFVRRR